MLRLTFIAALFLALIGIFIPYRITRAESSASISLQSSAFDLIAEVNALRVANGLPAYIVNPILMQVAQAQAAYMAATGQVAHRPGLTQRILDAGYPLAGDLSAGGFRAENITAGNITASQAVQGWTGDALHLDTMLSPNLTEIGAGVATVGGRHYMVILCARPTTSGQPQAYTPVPGNAGTEVFSSSDFIVPITTSTPDENGLIYHEVQHGQSLWVIAIEYGVKIDEIRVLNDLGAAIEIYPGDRLLIRKGAPTSFVTATLAVENTSIPTETLRTTTTQSVPTSILVSTEVLAVHVKNSEDNSVAGIAIGIALVTLLFAGLLTWISSRRSV